MKKLALTSFGRCRMVLRHVQLSKRARATNYDDVVQAISAHILDMPCVIDIVRFFAGAAFGRTQNARNDTGGWPSERA